MSSRGAHWNTQPSRLPRNLAYVYKLIHLSLNGGQVNPSEWPAEHVLKKCTQGWMMTCLQHSHNNDYFTTTPTVRSNKVLNVSYTYDLRMGVPGKIQMTKRYWQSDKVNLLTGKNNSSKIFTSEIYIGKWVNFNIFHICRSQYISGSKRLDFVDDFADEY